MARLIFISPYLKGGENRAQLAHRTNYIATQEGVELLKSEHGSEPATKKQREYITRLSKVSRSQRSWPSMERLGYTDVDNWRALVNSCAAEIANGYKIPLEHLRWYAALHEKEKHVHIHMVVFSSDPKEGYLTRQGIRDVKSAFATRIFEQDLIQVYARKTEYRNTLQRSAQERMTELASSMNSGAAISEKLEHLVSELAERLRSTKGKKVYGYLPPQVKRVVAEIVDELARDERVSEAYSLWQDMQDEAVRPTTRNIFWIT